MPTSVRYWYRLLGVCAATALPPLGARAELHGYRSNHRPLPAVQSLKMRAPQQGDAQSKRVATTRTAPLPNATPVTRRRAQPSATQSLIFRFNIGLGLDGGDPSGQPLASGSQLDQLNHYEKLRVYGFGDAVVGTRGLGWKPLSTYFAAQFRLDQDTNRSSTAVPTIHDNSRVGETLIRSGYAEANHMFENKWLKPVYIRAGRQFRYGPAIAHFDGISAGYRTNALTLGVFTGGRVAHFGHTSAVITGVEARFDMWELKQVPLVIAGSLLNYDNNTHFVGSISLKWSDAILLGTHARILNQAFARQGVTLRARISKVTTVSVEAENRARGDWSYDLVVSSGTYDATDARRYLNLGPPLPRAYATVRAGTVLVDNIDLLVRAAGAVEHADANAPANTFAASYFEAGAALEVRARSTLALGVSALARIVARDNATAPPLSDNPDPLLAATGHLGETSFWEGGMTMRFTAGARIFSAQAEAYGRIYNRPSIYVPSQQHDLDVRGGVRFSIDGWAGQRLRLRGEYDVAVAPAAFAPELQSIKSLRVVAEGTL